jgi:hypothetical protein
MWFRSTLTSLLVVVLLFGSNMASTCATSCELATMRPAAHASSQHSSDAAATDQSEPDHCGHTAARQERLTQHEARVTPQCGANVCNQDQAAVLADDASQPQPVPFVVATSSPVVGLKRVITLATVTTSESAPHGPPRLSAVLRL